MWPGERAPTQKFCTKVLLYGNKTASSSPSKTLGRAQQAHDGFFLVLQATAPPLTCWGKPRSCGKLFPFLVLSAVRGHLFAAWSISWWLFAQRTNKTAWAVYFRCGIYFHSSYEPLGGKTEKVDFIFQIDVIILCKKEREKKKKNTPSPSHPSLPHRPKCVSCLNPKPWWQRWWEGEALLGKLGDSPSGDRLFLGTSRSHSVTDDLLRVLYMYICSIYVYIYYINIYLPLDFSSLEINIDSVGTEKWGRKKKCPTFWPSFDCRDTFHGWLQGLRGWSRSWEQPWNTLFRAGSPIGW